MAAPEKFLVELYVAKGDSAAVEDGGERLRRAAEEVSRHGQPVRYVRSIFVPEDETCFHVLEASSRERLEETARRAAVAYERIAAAAESVAGETTERSA